MLKFQLYDSHDTNERRSISNSAFGTVNRMRINTLLEVELDKCKEKFKKWRNTPIFNVHV